MEASATSTSRQRGVSSLNTRDFQTRCTSRAQRASERGVSERSFWVTRKGVQLKGGGAIDLGQLYCKCTAPETCIALYCKPCVAREDPATHLRPG
eukprot:5174771-Pyramimonas_sp.AAC.1